jgi:hypothetical protein
MNAKHHTGVLRIRGALIRPGRFLKYTVSSAQAIACGRAKPSDFWNFLRFSDFWEKDKM